MADNTPKDVNGNNGIARRLRSWFSRQGEGREYPEPDEDPLRYPESERKVEAAVKNFLAIGLEESASPDFKLLRLLRERLAHLERYYFEQGDREGKYGKQSSNQEVYKEANDKVKQLQRDIVIAATRELGEWKERREAEQETSENKKSLLDDHLEYHKQLEDQAQLHSNSFGWGLGLFYALAGVALIIADIPLALQLTRKGFDLPRGTKDFSDLFTNFKYVFTQNWEVFILAIGVALCTIYIKIFWDEFLATPVEDALRNHQRLRMLAKATEKEGDTKENRSIADSIIRENQRVVKQQKWIRISAKSVVLVFTIVTIVVLGNFRVEVQKEEIEEKKLVNVERRMALLGESQEEAEANAPQGWGQYANYTYILLTLLFPIIGGICLSKGISNIHNFRALKKARRRSEELEHKYLIHKKGDIQVASKLFSQISDFIALIKDPEFTQIVTNDMVASYHRGFNHGLGDSLKGLGDDYYALAKEYRAKLTKRKIFESINPPNLPSNANGKSDEDYNDSINPDRDDKDARNE